MVNKLTVYVYIFNFNNLTLVRFEVHTAVIGYVFWVVTPCRLVGRYWSTDCV